MSGLILYETSNIIHGGGKNAMVIATILGPCRAFEPHDIQQ